MTTAQVVHSTDVGTGLEIVGGKVVPAASMTTDLEMDAARIAARDEAIAVASADAQAKADASQAAATASAQAMVDVSSATGAASDAAQDAAAANESTSDNVTRMAQAAFTHNWTVDVQVGGNLRLRGNGRGYERGIVIGAGRGAHASSNGFWDIKAPTAGVTIKGIGTADRVVAADGFIQNFAHDWSSLYFRLPSQGTPVGSVLEWVMVTHNEGGYEVTDDMVLVGTMNHDEGGAPYFQLADGTKCFVGTTYPDSPWIALPLASGVSNYGGAYQVCQFRRKGNHVYVRGMCNAAGTGFGGVGSTILAVLPEGFRPPSRIIKVVNHNEGSSRLDITPDGTIKHSASNAALPWVPLEFDFDLLA